MFPDYVTDRAEDGASKDDLQQELAVRDGIIDQLREERDTQQNEMFNLMEQLTCKKDQLKKHETLANDRKKSLAAKEKQITSLHSKIKEQNKEQADSQKLVNNLRQEIKSSVRNDARVIELTKKSDDLQRKLDEITVKLASRVEELARCQKAAEKNKKQIKELKELCKNGSVGNQDDGSDAYFKFKQKAAQLTNNPKELVSIESIHKLKQQFEDAQNARDSNKQEVNELTQKVNELQLKVANQTNVINKLKKDLDAANNARDNDDISDEDYQDLPSALLSGFRSCSTSGSGPQQRHPFYF